MSLRALVFCALLVTMAISQSPPHAAAAGDFWVTRSSMTIPRNGHASANVNGKIYVIGGHSPTRLASVEQYDPATDAWSPRTPMPMARSYHAAGAVGGKIYVVGGFDGVAYSKTTYEYTPDTDSWIVKADMPTARAGLAVAVLNDRILAIGGANFGGEVETVEEYDPVTDTWTTRSPMPQARVSPAATVIADKIYVVGGCAASCGYDGTGASSETLEYDPLTNSWTAKAPLPTARWALAAQTVGGRVFAVGGLGNNGVHYSELDEFDPASNRWIVRSSLAGNRQGLTAEVVAGKLYAIGGHNQEGGSYIGAIEEYTPTPAPPGDAAVKRIHSPHRLQLSAGATGTAATTVVVENEGAQTDDIGVYLAFLPPGGTGNLGGCSPVDVLNWVSLATGGAQAISKDVPAGGRVKLRADIVWFCTGPSLVDGGNWTLKAIADHGADDFSSCNTLTEVFNGSCEAALSDDDPTAGNNTMSRALPIVRFVP